MALSVSHPDNDIAAPRSVFTSNLLGLFDRLQIGLVISTYQAGKVILVRSDHGALNTHSRTFVNPVGYTGVPGDEFVGDGLAALSRAAMPGAKKVLLRP